MFGFLKRKKKSVAVAGEIEDDEFGTPTKENNFGIVDVKEAKLNENEENLTENTEKTSNYDINNNFAESYNKTNNQEQKKELTLEEKAIEMIKNSSLKKYYDLMEESVGHKTKRQLVDGINEEVGDLFDACGVVISGNEDNETKLKYAQKVFDFIVKNIEYDPILTTFMRIANEKIYHEDINKEILKEVYYELYNFSGTCLADSCVLAYMFEKIGLDAVAVALGDHSMVEVTIDNKKFYCDSTYERGILQGLDKVAIADGKGYGDGFMQDENLLNIQSKGRGKDFSFPKMSAVFEANVIKEELERE